MTPVLRWVCIHSSPAKTEEKPKVHFLPFAPITDPSKPAMYRFSIAVLTLHHLHDHSASFACETTPILLQPAWGCRDPCSHQDQCFAPMGGQRPGDHRATASCRISRREKSTARRVCSAGFPSSDKLKHRAGLPPDPKRELMDI